MTPTMTPTTTPTLPSEPDRVLDFQTIKGGNAKGSVTVSEKLDIYQGGHKGVKLNPRQRSFVIPSIKDGDKRVVWDSSDLDQINEAKALFDQLIQEGLVPYRVGLDGKATSESMNEFDPDAEEVIFLAIAAQVTGG
jgi:hypothetical protein